MDEMPAQIAEKAAEVMSAERFSLFLYDRGRDELFTTAALGLNKEKNQDPVISRVGVHLLSHFQLLPLLKAKPHEQQRPLDRSVDS